MKRSLQLSPVVSLTSFTGDGELVAFSVGPDRMIYLVVALRPLDYRTQKPGEASSPKTIPVQPQSYRVIGLSDARPVLNVVIEQERFNIHYIQPLLDELLLVCARSHYRGPDNFERNGRIYSRGGKLQREILLGDGINSVQTTSNGVIWTSFSDEGVFGNYGSRDPVGSSGLVAWDAIGNKLYEFQPSAFLDSICDCYALNVESNEDVWVYYYTEFPLVHLHDREIQSIWKMPLGGSDAFAVSGEHALFRGGYNDRDTYRLFSLEREGMAKLIAELELQDQNGDNLQANWVIGLADTIYCIDSGSVYCVDVRSAIQMQL